MKNSCQFVVAVHILTMLRSREEAARRFGQDVRATSDEIAESVNTNPVVIRRILGHLQKADLVITKTGRGGGTTLARSADQITLRDIFAAVEDTDLFRMHHNTPSQSCPIGGNIQGVMQEVLDEAYDAMKEVLASKTVEELFASIMERSGLQDRLEAGLSYEEICAEFEGAPALGEDCP